MWAGIWIDGRFAAAAPLLRAITEDGPASPCVPARTTPPPRTLAPPPAGLPHSSPTGVHHTGKEEFPPRALIFARSEGYCEVMATDCRLVAQAIVPRVPNHGGGDASMQFAVCQECAITLRRMDYQLVQRLGYRVENAASAASTPFFWRQQHRVLLDAGGGLHSAAAPQRKIAELS